MSANCLKSTAIVGDPIIMNAIGTQGTPPFTFIFQKDGNEVAAMTGVPANVQKTFTYIVAPGDMGNRRFSVAIIDSANQYCTEYCDVSVGPAPVCDFEVT